MQNFTIEAKYKINAVDKTKILQIDGNDAEHAFLIAKMRIMTLVTDRDPGSLSSANVPEIEFTSVKVIERWRE